MHVALRRPAWGQAHVKVCSHSASISSMSLYRPCCIAGTTCTPADGMGSSHAVTQAQHQGAGAKQLLSPVTVRP